MADYENLLDSIDAVIKSNNRREITGQILQNTLHQMVGSLGENYQLAGFATPTLDPNSPDQNVFYITDEAGIYTNFDNITLGAGLSFLMWKNEEWTSKTLDVVTADWLDEHYVSKAFLRKVFQFFDEDGVEIFPNDTESVVDNIKAMCGLWTNEYLSALGLGEGSTIPTTLAALNDVTITNPQDGQALVYDAASLHWVNATIQSGVDMSVVWAALAGATNEQINISHLSTALNDYVTATSLATTLQSYVTTSALATELASYASQSWVETNYVSKAFFNSLFEAQDVNGNAITPNNSGQTTIDRLKILVGAYTEQYLSALGLSSGGGGGGSSTLAGLNDVTITNPQDGQALIYDVQSSHWINGAAISMSAVWTALAAATSEQINSSHLTSALSGYVTTSALASELANYVTTSGLATTLADYVTTSALTTTLADYGSKTWIDNNYVSKTFFNRLFQAFAPLAEGQTEPTQVEPNDTTTTIDNIKAMFGLWTEQYLSALGLSAGGGHTIGVLNDLNDVTITNPQTNQVLKYNGTQWVNDTAPSGASALSGLTDVAISSLADKDLLQWDYATGKWKNVVLSTAMSGYATTSQLANYLPLSGGTINNTLKITHRLNVGYDVGDWDSYRAEVEIITAANDAADLWFGTNSERQWVINTRGTVDNNEFRISNYSNGPFLRISTNGYVAIGDFTPTEKLSIYGYVWALSGYKINNGTSSQFLKADGSIDSTNYFPTSGGYLSGTLYSADSFYMENGQYGIDMRNSDIIGVNGIYTNDTAEGWREGINFRRSNNNYDSIRALNGDMYFDVNNGSSTYTVIHSGNINSYVGGGTADYTKFLLLKDNSRLSSANVNIGAWTRRGMDLSLIDSTTTDAPPYTTSHDGHLLTFAWDNSSWGAQLHLTMRYNDDMHWRSSDANNGGWQAWKKILDSRNYSSYALPLSGGTVTGTTYFSGEVFATLHLAVGVAQTTFVPNRAEVDICTSIDDAADLWFGTNSTRQWVINTRPSNESNKFRLNCTIGSGTVLTMTTDGRLGLSEDNPSYRLHVAGDIYATGGVTALSDIRHKTIVEDTRLQVSDIARMRAVIYLWNDGREDNGMHVGSIAQDWQQILPEVVLRANNDEGTLSLQYGVAALVSAIVTARKVVNHEERIKALERENADLKQSYSFIKNAYDYLKMDYENLKLKIA